MGKHARLTFGVSILNSSSELKNIVRLCCTLPLLPQNLIQRGFDLVGEAAVTQFNVLDYICIVRPYLEYIQYDWILHVNRGPTLSVCRSENRTNNAR